MQFGKEISYMKRVQSLAGQGAQPQNQYFDREGLIYSLNALLPGHVFTFEYLDSVDGSEVMSIPDYLVQENIGQPALGKDARTKEAKQIAKKLIDGKGYKTTKPYYDMKPIGFALTGFEDKTAEYILNIKCMPRVERNLIMEALFRGIVPHMLRWGTDTQGDKLEFSKRIQNKEYLAPFLTFNMNPITDTLGNGIYFWVNKYQRDRIRNVKLIDFDQLPKLGFADYGRDAYTRFNSTNLTEVQSTYMTKLKNR